LAHNVYSLAVIAIKQGNGDILFTQRVNRRN